jgi:hypothetical protein
MWRSMVLRCHLNKCSLSVQLNAEVNCTETSRAVSVPCLVLYIAFGFVPKTIGQLPPEVT